MSGLEALLTSVGLTLLIGSLFFMAPVALWFGLGGATLLLIGLGSCFYTLNREVEKMYGRRDEQ